MDQKLMETKKKATDAFLEYEKAICDTYNLPPGGRVDASLLMLTLQSNDVQRIERMTEWFSSEAEAWRNTIR